MVSPRNPTERAQLTRIWKDRTRSSVALPLDWRATNSTAILTTVGQLRALMEGGTLSPQDAMRLNIEAHSGAKKGEAGFKRHHHQD